MKTVNGIGLGEVQAVYSGPEGDLWELVMGEQIHLGGLSSSLALAEKAGIGPGMAGIDLCCCNGAGMRVLVRFRNVARMQGVDATEKVVRRGQRRCAAEKLADRISFTQADACDTGLPAGQADFVWGEDAWCYVVDKERLIAEACRLVKPGGTIAFTDWIEGPRGLSQAEADRFLTFMKFPNIQDLSGYAALLTGRGCRCWRPKTRGASPPAWTCTSTCSARSLTYDALRIIGFDSALMESLGGEMQFIRDPGPRRKDCPRPVRGPGPTPA